MKAKDLPNEPHYAIIEFDSHQSSSDDWYREIDDVNYKTFKTLEALEDAIAERFVSGNKKTYRVISVTPMDVAVKAVASVKLVNAS